MALVYASPCLEDVEADAGAMEDQLRAEIARAEARVRDMVKAVQVGQHIRLTPC